MAADAPVFREGPRTILDGLHRTRCPLAGIIDVEVMSVAAAKSALVAYGIYKDVTQFPPHYERDLLVYVERRQALGPAKLEIRVLEDTLDVPHELTVLNDGE
jgi:hypothetical protein